MNVLIVDTCGTTGSVAIAGNTPEPGIAASASLPGRSASERLVATIKEIAARPGLGLESLGAIAVVCGPGSFTGVRVGLSAAKGLCEALNLPLIAISRLAVLAHLADPLAHRVLALFDAGRGEFYLGEYSSGACLREALVTRDELLAIAKSALETVPETIIATCESQVAQSVAELSPRLLLEPTAAHALPLVLRRLHDRAFDDIAAIDANYLRRTDAEIFAKPPVSSRSPGP